MVTLHRKTMERKKTKRNAVQSLREGARRFVAFNKRRLAVFTPKKLPPLLNAEVAKARENHDYGRAAIFLEKLGKKLELLYPECMTSEEIMQLSKVYKDAARFYDEVGKPKKAARVTERLAGIYESDCNRNNAAMMYIATAYSYLYLSKNGKAGHIKKAAELYWKAASLYNGDKAEKFRDTAKNLIETAQQSI